MTEKKQDKQFFSVGRVFFLLIVIPLSLVAFLIANGIFKVGETARERAVSVLDQKSQEEIKIRAINTADEVASFLKERENDILVATVLPATESAYKTFAMKTKGVWVKKDNKIQQIDMPLYVEMALVDKSGNELIKIRNGEVAPKAKLVNVSNPANTLYKSEDYFSKTIALNKAEVYVSRVTGWYVSKPDFEKGKRYSGIVRFATPVFDKSGVSGIVVMALDMRHLAAYTDHIVPTQSERVFEADAATGNYAYMVDNQGFVVSHPNDYHIEGLYPSGRPVPPLTKETADAQIKRGEEVLNLNLLAFMDPKLPAITADAAAGKMGLMSYTFAGHTKFVAYAPIKYFSRNYPKPAGFGWIGMGVDVGKFNEMVVAASKKIDQEVKSWTTAIVVIIIASMILLFGIAALLARGISRSIEKEVPEGAVPLEHYDEDEDEEDK
ncbi:MAG: cache domain-containing protein [Deltaproteobacteria bacterium]|nr:cache domain-containing protein [Deltaproteobacteria bacterium]